MSDATQNYIAKISGQNDSGQADLIALPRTVLTGIRQEIATLNATVPLPCIGADERQRATAQAAGHPVELPELLNTAAAAMRKSPGAAEAIGAPPELFETVATQGIALGGLVLRASNLEDRAGDGAILISRAVTTQTGTLNQFVADAAAQPPTQQTADVESAFSAAIKRQAEVSGVKARALTKAGKQVATENARLQQETDAANALTTINSFLKSIT